MIHKFESNKVADEKINDFKEMIKDGYAIVDIWASWCAPCLAIAPVFKKFSESYPKVKFIKIDLDAHMEIATHLDVTTIPAFILFKEGKRVEANHINNMSKSDELEALLKITS